MKKVLLYYSSKNNLNLGEYLEEDEIETNNSKLKKKINQIFNKYSDIKITIIVYKL